MCVPAENVSRVVVSRQPQGSFRYVKRQPLPVGVQVVQQPRQPVPQETDLLEQKVDRGHEMSEERCAVRPQAVELMSVHRDALLVVPFPFVPLVHLDAEQMLHHVRDARVVVALNPHHFNATLRIAEFADVADEPPVLLGQAGEVQVLEDVAQQDESLERAILKKVQQVGCETEIGAEMYVRHDQGFAIHLYNRVAKPCYNHVKSVGVLSRVAQHVEVEFGLPNEQPTELSALRVTEWVVTDDEVFGLADEHIKDNISSGEFLPPPRPC